MDDPCETCKLPVTTIDEIYNQVLKKLTTAGQIKHVSGRLASFNNHPDRALYCYNLLNDLGLLPILKCNPKNDVTAIFYRNQGNKYFMDKQYFEAWQFYNLSLLYAVPLSDPYIYAVSNRSAVFFAMGKYEECRQDITFILNKSYPENLRKKLTERKLKCEAKLSAVNSDKNKYNELDDKIAQILRMKSPKDEKYVCASSKLKVVYTEEMGRHVIAKEDIAVGEVLAQEDPYLTVLLRHQFLFCCAYCLSRSYNLFPCTNCVYTLYCSALCCSMAFEKYHVIECSLMPTLVSMEFTKMEWLALRILIQSKTDSMCEWHEMIHIAREAESKTKTDKWGCEMENEKWVYDSENYTSIHTLASNIEKRSVSDVFRKSITAAALTHGMYILHCSEIETLERTSMFAKYVSGALVHHIMTSPTNMHGISANIGNADGKFVEEFSIASGAYAFHSLLNHSCAPNVVRYCKLGTSRMTLFAIRPIKKGMQLFDNYGYHYAVQDRESRQSNLLFQYKFQCACEACVGDWPMHGYIPDARGAPAGVKQLKEKVLSIRVIERLMAGDKKVALENFQALCDLVEIYDPFAPCRELAECQEAVKQCLVIFQGLVPFGYSKEVEWKAIPDIVDTSTHNHLPEDIIDAEILPHL